MAKKPRLHVVALAAAKGGAGKSTLTTLLAVQAAKEGNRVALIDVDPQESLSSWWDRRGKVDNPKLFEGVDAATEAIELIIAEGFDWVFIDTPPAMLDKIEAAVACADFVIIPTRTSALDIETVGIVERMCQEWRKPYAFALNAVMPNSKLTSSTAQYLSLNRRTVLQPYIQFREAHIAGMTVGKSGAEIDKGRATREEAEAFWRAVKEAATKAAKRGAR